MASVSSIYDGSQRLKNDFYVFDVESFLGREGEVNSMMNTPEYVGDGMDFQKRAASVRVREARLGMRVDSEDGSLPTTAPMTSQRPFKEIKRFRYFHFLNWLQQI